MWQIARRLAWKPATAEIMARRLADLNRRAGLTAKLLPVNGFGNRSARAPMAVRHWTRNVAENRPRATLFRRLTPVSSTPIAAAAPRGDGPPRRDL
jgi:hypothetical protein